MAELKLPPLFAHAPENRPPAQGRSTLVLLIPALLAIIGMLIALTAATAGQDSRRANEQRDIQNDRTRLHLQLELAQQLRQDPDVIDKLQKDLDLQLKIRGSSYARYGRVFTAWDGYHYEEIIDQGYAFHMPDASEHEKEQSQVTIPGETERRAKNVVWYPLYPILGWIVAKCFGITSTLALTIVSWLCCMAASIVIFQYARRHYYNRMPALDLDNESVAMLEAHPARRWDLSPPDTAALWVVAALLFGPCAIFLYANFTESLFVLLLACFLYCLQSRWWWRAALVAGVASACRSQGVLFGPILALTYLLRSNQRDPFKKVGFATLLGFISAIGLMCYMAFLYHRFGDALAFMHGQRYWNVGISADRIRYALNPMHAMTRLFLLACYSGPVDWPRVWEMACVLWPPVVLLIFGARYLSFELEVVGWIMWGLPYVSNSMAGNPPMDSQWMSMGRFMAVMIPIYIVFGALFVRVKWLGLAFIVIWAGVFALFAYMYGMGMWIG